MDKPISMMIEEFQTNMVNLINTSRLHPVILDMVMSTMAKEVHEFAIGQAQQESMMYEQSLQENKDVEESA